MRKAGLERLSDVRFAVLEPDGMISIVPNTPAPLLHNPSEKKAAGG